MLQAGPRHSWEKPLPEHPASEHTELPALLPLLSAGSLGGRSTAHSCLRCSLLPASCSGGGSLLGVVPRMRAPGSIQSSQGAEPPPSSSAPTVAGGCCTGGCCTSECCTSGCSTGSVKRSARAALIVLRARDTAAWTASLFGREKARTGAVRVSRSHARLETRPRVQTINARGRREGKGGVGMSGNGMDSKRAQGSSQTDRQTCRTMSLPAEQRHRGLCCISCHQQHPNFSLHCYPCSVGDKVLS